MKEFFSVSIKKKLEIEEKISGILFREKNVIFSLIYGSFLFSPSFRDIDIGIYISKPEKNQVLELETELSRKIAQAVELPIDAVEVAILNFAPNHFLSNIFSKGKTLFCKDEKLLSDLMENSSLEAIANENAAVQSLKELIPV